MFGDNFSDWGMKGEWQSPSIVMYDDDYQVLGIPTASGIASEGRRRQLWDYPHNNPEYSTILPTDFIKVAGIWYVARHGHRRPRQRAAHSVLAVPQPRRLGEDRTLCGDQPPVQSRRG